VWLETFEFARLTLTVICCAAAVKLVDDFLDQDLDLHAGRTNWAEILGRSTMIYAMLLMVFAAGLNAPISLSLFLGSYIVGMFSDIKRRFPSKLNGLQEMIVVFALGACLFGWQLMLFSLLFVLSVQLFDDCIDRRVDRLAGHCNLAMRLGFIECLLLATMSLLVSWWLNEQLFMPIFCGTAVFYSLTFWHQGVHR
jgi:4-hydroxybenzoate polyprenyltransferase